MSRIMSFGCLLLVLLCVLFAAPQYAAAEGFTFTCIPPTGRERTCTVEIEASYPVSAAVMELGFDPGIVEPGAVSAAAAASTVRYSGADGLLRIAFCDSAGVSGTLCRATFKTPAAGECRFTLHIVQAVDGDLHFRDVPNDEELTVSFGGTEPADTGASGSRSSRAASSVRSRSVDKKSAASRTAESLGADPPSATEGLSRSGGSAELPRVIDVSGDRGLTYIGIGACSVLLMGALVLTGFLIGRRLRSNPERRKSTDAPEPPADPAEEQESLSVTDDPPRE